MSLDSDHDMILNLAVNFYRDVNQAEASEFYQILEKNDSSSKKISYGLNSRLIKEDGKIKEQVWRVGGVYSKAIEEIVSWLEKKAKDVAESDLQRQSLAKLISYYRTADLAAFDEYNILWVQDTAPTIDITNGFI